MILLWHAHDISYQVSFDFFFFFMYILTQEEHFKENSSLVDTFLKLLRHILLLVKFCLSKQKFDFQFILGLKQKSKLKL